MRPEHWRYTIPQRIRSLFKRRTADLELDEELQFHLDQETNELISKGLSEKDARDAAVREFRGLQQSRENCRDTRKINWIQDFVQDLRFGARMLRKNRGFAAVAILTLALGIGANTAIFSVVDAVLLRSLPFRDAGRLVAISETYPNIPDIGASTADLEDWRAQSHSLSELAAYNLTRLGNSTLIVKGGAEDVHAAIIAHNLFPLLGIAPAIGRTFLPEEDKLGNGPVAILSGEIWKTTFASDPNILGRSVTLNQQSFTVVGVLPLKTRYPQNIDVWVPL